MPADDLRLSSAAREPIAPEALRAAEWALDPADAERLAQLARRDGRVLERDGLGVFAFRVAARITAPRGFSGTGSGDAAQSLLAAIPSRDGAPARPLALGALPFRPGDEASLVVPELAVVRDGRGERAVCVSEPSRAPEAVLAEALERAAGAAARPEPPDRFELVSATSHRAFRDLVAEARDAVRFGSLDKVVVAREVTVHANRPFEAGDLLERLRALYPSCAAFSLDGFVGASPELLCRREGRRVVAQPLAGTVARSGDPDEDRRLATSLLHSAKDRTEHRIVVEAIVQDLAKLADEIDVGEGPHLLELRNVVHLATSIGASLPAEAPSALEVALALHPTPAVGGWPKEPALAWLASHEQLGRDRYAGPLGYLDAAGDGEFWLGIRSALISGSSARLLAGVGIVADSDPAAELAETQLKLQALLAAAVRP